MILGGLFRAYPAALLPDLLAGHPCAYAYPVLDSTSPPNPCLPLHSSIHQAFAEHIKFCANKIALGVNFMPNTPNYDRVVEMQALVESLQKAFPDYPNDRDYPWPDHERKGEAGTGWVQAPQPPSLNLKDPAIEIFKLAMGRSRRGSSAGTSRGPSPGAESPVGPGSPSKATPRSGAATFLTAEASTDAAAGAGAGAGLPPRPSTASPGGPAMAAGGGRHGRPMSAMAGSGDAVTGLRRSESTGRPQSARPPASPYLAGAATAAAGGSGSGSGTYPDSPPLAVRQLRRPESAGRMRFSNLVAPELGGGGGGGSGAAAPTSWLHRSYSAEGQSPLAAAAAAAGASGRRPGSATTRPLSARVGGGGGPGPTHGHVQRPMSAVAQRPASASARPPSASRQQQHLPARVAAKLNGMQSTLSAIRSAAGGAGSPTALRPPLAGFTRDLPRLQYAEVDVKALE